MLKIVFCGSPEFAAVSLRYLIDKRMDIKAVVTMPDKKQGRGQNIKFNPVKTMAVEKGITVLQPDKATCPEFLQMLSDIKPDIIAVVAYGKILRKQFIDIPKFGCVNLHSSLLPQYRGPSPIHWALMNGDKVTGVTTFLIDEGMDTGDIILEKQIPILDSDNLGTLHDKLAYEGAELLYNTITAFENSVMPETHKQKHEEAVYTGKITTETTIINWNASVVKIHNLIRAMAPIPGARTTIKIHDKILGLKILKSQISQQNTRGNYGEIIDVSKEKFTVSCGCGALDALEIQLEGKNAMSTEAFLRGYPLQKGSFLGILS